MMVLLRQLGTVRLLKLTFALGVLVLLLFMYLDREKAMRQAGWMKQINDSTQAVLVAERTQHANELKALRDAAKQMKGKLVAGVKITTPADTVYAPMEEVITSRVDSTRTATRTDTTEMGVQVTVNAEAPPFPAPLKLGYQVIVPPFAPEVGFVKVGNQYAAVVSWAGQTHTIKDGFYLPEGSHRPAWALTTGGSIVVEESVQWDPALQVSIRRRLGERGTFVATGQARSKSGPELVLGYERVLWSSK